MRKTRHVITGKAGRWIHDQLIKELQIDNENSIDQASKERLEKYRKLWLKIESVGGYTLAEDDNETVTIFRNNSYRGPKKN